MNTIQFSSQLAISFKLMKISLLHNLVVSSVNENNRRQEMWNFLNAENLVGFNHTNEYDYVIVDTLKSPAAIYDIYNKHNDKLVIFDTDKLLQKTYLDIAEGGFCSSPDSGEKWAVRFNSRKEFLFTGHVIIMTSLSAEDLKKKKVKFKYILRDMQIL
jgi:hypothetical protein